MVITMDRNHKLEILIPQYNESDATVKPLLDSISLQQGIDLSDIGVIICNDGSDMLLSDDLISSYPYCISYHKLPHKGVSATRNACLDFSTSDYIMFCDADDLFLNNLGIWLIFEEIQKGEFDDLTSEFLAEEYDDSGKFHYGVYDHDGIFVHGKVFRRQYILDNNIRFNENLRLCEDCNFVSLAQSLTDNHRYITLPFYIWKWRKGSVSRTGASINFDMQIQMLESNRDLLDKLIDRNLANIAEKYAVQMIIGFFYTTNASELVYPRDSDEYKTILKGYLDWYRTYGYLWKSTSINRKIIIIEKLFVDSIIESPVKDAININKWVHTTFDLDYK